MHEHDMHIIQRRIIRRLAQNAPQRFSELLPRGLPNNTFSYHLKKLLQTGYIAQEKDGYVATRKAFKTLQFGHAQDNRKLTPITISMIYTTNASGEVLLIRRRMQPFKYWCGVPSGLIHQNETLLDAARRELFEKTTIKASGALKSAGVLDFRYVDENSSDTFFHAIAFIYHYKYRGDTSTLEGLETKYGKLRWSTLRSEDILPEVYAIADIIDNRKLSVTSMTFTEPDLSTKPKKPQKV